jgi:hypothetical protein
MRRKIVVWGTACAVSNPKDSNVVGRAPGSVGSMSCVCSLFTESVTRKKVDKTETFNHLTSVCYRCNVTRGGRDCVIGIATGYELDGTGFESRWGRDFSDSARLPLRPTQPPGLFPRVKRIGRGSDHPPPPSAGVENGFSSTSSSPLCLTDLT